MEKLTIIETIDNMIDELNRADEFLSELPQNDSIIELREDIKETLMYELDFFKERIDLALLISAGVSDVSVCTCEKIYEAEREYELPVSDGIIDTEIVYNTIDDVADKVIKQIDYLNY